MKKTITLLYNTTVYVYKFRINLIQKIQELNSKSEHKRLLAQKPGVN